MIRHKLPQRASEQEGLLRRQSIAAQREQYRWRKVPGLPPHCDGVPAAEKRSPIETENLLWNVGGSLSNAAVSVIKRFRHRPRTIDYFDSYYSVRPKPSLYAGDRWRTDEEFGRQRLAGVNPYAIRRLATMPPNLDVRDEDLPQTVGPHTLTSLISDARLYVLDHRALEGVPVRDGRFCSAPIALFWVDDAGRLMPLAVQLTQMPALPRMVFTPDDDEWLWQRVKADVQAADAAYHEVIAHLLRTHLVMETVWVAACRSLPELHPLHELLSNHFTGTIAVNESARTVMLAKGGPIDEAISVGADGAMWLIDQELGTFSFADFHPIVDLQERGVDDAGSLPGYHYRDDARRHWSAINRYVHDLLRIYYRSDEDVQEDHELQAWAWEMSDREAGMIDGLPLDGNSQFARFEDLQRTIAQIVFCCTAEHAAVNNGQWDIFGYIPNAPGAMWTPPPTSKRPSDEAEFCAAMPLPHAIAQQMMMAFLLSAPPANPIGTTDRQWFNDNHDVRHVLDRFRTDRDDITDTIARRNTHLAVPYTYLDPQRVGRSIAI